MTIYTSRRVSSIRVLDLGDQDHFPRKEADLPDCRASLFGSYHSQAESETDASTKCDDSDSDSSISLFDDGFADDDSWYHEELGSYSTEFQRSLSSDCGYTTAAGRPSTETYMTIGTFNSLLLHESFSNENTIMRKKDSFCSLPISEDEQDESEKAHSSTFSRNVGFLGGLISEAASNILKTVTVLREEPRAGVLKAVVQTKVENLGNNVGTLTSRICTNTSTLCSDGAKDGANLLGLSQHGFGRRNNEHGGGANWLGCSVHGYGNRNGGYRGVQNSMGRTVHGYGKNHLKQ